MPTVRYAVCHYLVTPLKPPKNNNYNPSRTETRLEFSRGIIEFVFVVGCVRAKHVKERGTDRVTNSNNIVDNINQSKPVTVL